MNNIKIQDLAVKHDYYSSDSNYYSHEPRGWFETWSQFNEAYGIAVADVDMNLAFRWDIALNEDSDKDNHYYMEVFIIKQRKGIYSPVHINTVTDDDVPQILEYLQAHFNKLNNIWQPITI